MHQGIKRKKEVNWMSLTLLEIMEIKDKIKQDYCLRMRKDCLKRMISPLLINLPLHTGFKFSGSDENLSCKKMLEDLFIEYQKRNYTKEEIRNIILGRRVKKC